MKREREKVKDEKGESGRDKERKEKERISRTEEWSERK